MGRRFALRHSILCFAIACRFSVAAELPKTALPPTVAVYLQFAVPPTGAPIAQMERETVRLLAPAGVTVEWRSVDENRGNELFDRVVKVTFQGQCRADRARLPVVPFRLVQDGVLARTHVAGSHVLPETEVDCERISGAVSATGAFVTRRERDEALGRALGRVLAHELYHVLADTTGHSADGLAKARHSLPDLSSPDGVAFRESDARRIANTCRSSAN